MTIRRWLNPPQFETDYDNFAAKVLHYALLVLLGLVGSFPLFASATTQLFAIPPAIFVFGSCFILLHRRKLRLSGLIFVSGLWLIITVSAYALNGVRNSAISAYAIVIIFAAIVISNRALIVFTVLSVLSIIGLAIGETQGVFPLQTTPLYLADRVFQQIALFSTTGILLYASSYVITAGFERIRKDEQLLLARNRELEAQITRRQETEANLRVSDEKYRILFDNISAMAAVYDQNGRIVLINKAAADMLGYEREALIGRNIRDILPAEDAERAISRHSAVIASGEPYISEGHTQLPNGREVFYLRQIMPSPDIETNDSAIPHVLILTTDITEKYLIEQRERELALSQERNRFLAEFFGMVSHDLKTPLTVMNTSLYLLERARTPEQREERIARIADQVKLMDKYIQDMLMIARLEHLPTTHFETLNLNTLIEEVVEMLRPNIEEKRLNYRFEGETDLPTIQGEDEQLRRLLTNLIENAVNYTPDGGEIIVRTQTQSGYVLLEVKDSGIGIEPEALPRIFDRFFRAPQATTVTNRGTGLGLAIVKTIADKHTAVIDVRSEIGTGTTFHIQFPCDQIAAC